MARRREMLGMDNRYCTKEGLYKREYIKDGRRIIRNDKGIISSPAEFKGMIKV